MSEELVSRREFLAMAGLLPAIWPVNKIFNQETIEGQNDYVRQMGDKTIEFMGKTFEMRVDPLSVVKTSLLLAKVMGGDELVNKTAEWFVSNELLVKLVSDRKEDWYGSFWPPEMSLRGQAIVTIHGQVLEQRLQAEVLHKFPHELLHFIDYVSDPIEFLKKYIKSSPLEEMVISSLVFGGFFGGFGYLADRFLNGKDAGVQWGIASGIASGTAGGIIAAFFEENTIKEDFHQNPLVEDYNLGLRSLYISNETYREAVKGMIEFKQVD